MDQRHKQFPNLMKRLAHSIPTTASVPLQPFFVGSGFTKNTLCRIFNKKASAGLTMYIMEQPVMSCTAKVAHTHWTRSRREGAGLTQLGARDPGALLVYRGFRGAA